jgi:hypothetical protein
LGGQVFSWSVWDTNYCGATGTRLDSYPQQQETGVCFMRKDSYRGSAYAMFSDCPSANSGFVYMTVSRILIVILIKSKG